MIRETARLISARLARKLGQAPRMQSIHAGRPYRIGAITRRDWERRRSDRA